MSLLHVFQVIAAQITYLQGSYDGKSQSNIRLICYLCMLNYLFTSIRVIIILHDLFVVMNKVAIINYSLCF